MVVLLHIATRYHVINEITPQVSRFAGFGHHCLANISAHMHAYRYPLFESGMKTDL